MEIVKFDRVISVSNEIKGHEARNLLDEDIRPNKSWMCEKGTKKGVVILQLDRPTVFSSIHVGNAHSAFVEILVGRAADDDQQFESLVPMSILMKPNECHRSENKNQTRFFGKADFSGATAAKAWDRIKVVCSQPFNKCVPFGLCFLEVRGLKQDKKMNLPTRSDQEEIQIGSFFRKKRESEGNKPLSVSEQVKQAEKRLSLSTHTNISKLSTNTEDKLSAERKKIEEKSAEKILGIKTPKRKNEVKTPERGKKEEDLPPKRGKCETPKEHDEDKKSLKTKSIKKDDRMSKKRKEGKPKWRKKPFQKLMDDVVLVISGFKNPLRGDIRNMALQMGAKYSADWNSHCTHLVCAYENTPKFQQVKGKGKIVKKDWVEKCHEDKKRYPWRRFALDRSDCSRPESEEEIDGTDEVESEEKVVTRPKASTSGNEEREIGSPHKLSSGDEYDMATDDDEIDKTELETADYPMPFLPDIFSSKTFFIDPNVKARKVLERYIIAYNGTITETFNEDLEFYVTEKDKMPVELFRKKAPNLAVIKPSWIWEVRSKLECVPKTPHLVKSDKVQGEEGATGKEDASSEKPN